MGKALFSGEKAVRVCGENSNIFFVTRARSPVAVRKFQEREGGRGREGAADAEYSEYSGNASSRGLEIELRLSRNACLLDENTLLCGSFSRV